VYHIEDENVSISSLFVQLAGTSMQQILRGPGSSSSSNFQVVVVVVVTFFNHNFVNCKATLILRCIHRSTMKYAKLMFFNAEMFSFLFIMVT